MKSLTKLILFCVLLAGLCPASSAATSLLDSAYNLASLRHVNFDYLRQSEKILLDIIAREPRNVRACWMLARTCNYLGDHAPDADERVRFYGRGTGNAKQAIQIDSTCVWAHYWYMVNLGSIGQQKGFPSALTMVQELKDECSRMLQLEPCNALALEVTGMLYEGLPSFIGGSSKLAQEYLNRAIFCDSNYTSSYVDLARILIKEKKFSTAGTLCKRMLAVNTPTDAAENFMYDRPAAQKILEKIAGR
jgi:hypothetical protein